MLFSTRGIVFYSVPYSETSIIVKIYTEKFGLQSYLIKGSRRRSSRTRPSFLQSLTLLDMVVYHRVNKNLQTIREVQISYPYQFIPGDIRKEALIIFINELLYHSIREEEANRDLFMYIWDACMLLDKTESQVSTFHLLFAAALTRFLGIRHSSAYSPEFPFFNLKEGLFMSSSQNRQYLLDPDSGKRFANLFSFPIRDHGNLSYPSAIRDSLLDSMLFYYRLHLPGFPELKSHKVLRAVFS